MRQLHTRLQPGAVGDSELSEVARGARRHLVGQHGAIQHGRRDRLVDDGGARHVANDEARRRDAALRIAVVHLRRVNGDLRDASARPQQPVVSAERRRRERGVADHRRRAVEAHRPDRRTCREARLVRALDVHHDGVTLGEVRGGDRSLHREADVLPILLEALRKDRVPGLVRLRHDVEAPTEAADAALVVLAAAPLDDDIRGVLRRVRKVDESAIAQPTQLHLRRGRIRRVATDLGRGAPNAHDAVRRRRRLVGNNAVGHGAPGAADHVNRAHLRAVAAGCGQSEVDRPRLVDVARAVGPDGLHRHARVSPLAADELLERDGEVFDRRAAVREALPRRRHGERSRVVDVAVLPCRSEVVHGADDQRAPVAEHHAARAAARARQPVLVARDHDGAERRRVRQRAAVVALRIAVAAVEIDARAPRSAANAAAGTSGMISQ